MKNQMKFHLSLFVSDVEKSVAFYEKLFDQPVSKTKTDYFKFDLDNPGLVISFIKSPDKVKSDFGHLGFRVENLEALEGKKKLLKESLDITLEEENVACCYAKQDKFWVNDPDGYEWEVYHFLEDVNTDEPKHSAVSCC
ncbi:MAG: VOC family protein [Cyclobacteriaceae bacterium]